MQQAGVRPVTFARLAVVTALLTLGLIVFGAVVRVTDSGLGCGNHWPLCNGTVIPPLDNLTAWIEWLHRLFAVLIGLFGMGTLLLALRAYRRHDRRVLGMTLLAAVLFAMQSALGAIVVVLDLPPTFVTLHLGTAMLLLGSLLVAAVFAAYRPHLRITGADRVAPLSYLTAALALVIILTGALVRGSGATLACIDWPLCYGHVLPINQGQLAVIHMMHRAAVAVLGISLLVLLWTVYRDRTSPLSRGLALGAVVAYFAQAAVGAFFVLSAAAPLWGAAHVGLAAITWAVLVILSATEWMNGRERTSAGGVWKPQSEAAS